MWHDKEQSTMKPFIFFGITKNIGSLVFIKKDLGYTGFLLMQLIDFYYIYMQTIACKVIHSL